MSVPGTFDNSLTAWISQGFERLADRVQAAPLALHFDVLIIGSGYGGAIAAATFAGRELGGTPVTVGVLERGKEYLPGAFPKDMAELPRHIRRDGAKEGLFDIRLGPEVTTVVANGLGGGSLINAGVMEEPAATVFQKGWPAALSSLPTWVAHFGRARELLGSSHSGTPNTILNHPDGIPPKHQSIHAIAPSGTFRAAAITVAMNDTTSSGNVKLKKCLRCGDCATGCNFGAKNSLDVNLLVSAHQKGAEIFTGATVLSVEREMSGTWIVNSVPTNAALRARGGGPVRIRATKVVLAAGTLGSTEILLRSKSPALQFSGKLGQRCSTNGDMLITDYDTGGVVHTVADEAVRPSDRGIGPTITGIVDLRTTAGLVIEEMSVPAGLRRAFTEIFATTNALHSLAERDSSKHAQGFPNDDIYAVPAARIERSALYAVMGDDGAAGTIELVGDTADPRRDGVARIRWNKVQDLPVFDHQVATLSGLTQSSGGRVIPNPVWKLLPAEMTWLLKDQRGPLTTVHPLGGCAMADSGVDGAVDQHGRVFSSSSSSAVHDGLVVLDGSIIPTALGTNPSLTIAAVALRAAEALAGMWSYAAPGGGGVVAPPLDRPVFRETNVAATPQPTEVEIIERLVGPVTFRAANGVTATRVVELTLRFDPKALAALAKPPSDGGNPVLHVATSQSETMVRSKIRIYDAVLWEQIEKQYAPARRTEQKLDAIVLFSAPVSGSLRIFERQKTRALGRTLRAGWAWIRNRGLRDFWQAFGDDGPGWGSRIKSGVALASRSGEIRAFQYDLTIGTPDTGTTLTLSGHRILGSKRLTYNHRGNPWRQLMEVRLDQFPGLTAQSSERVLKLDVRYLARIGVPLLRIAKQGDGATAIGELASFFGYVVRLVLGLHIWSFRGPDKDTDPANDVVNPLPGINLPGLPPAQLYNLAVAAEAPEGGGPAIPGNVLLTRYPNPGSTKRPILMLHGYSASGTTFAHHAVNPNFASHFWSKGRDVWIADLRTSSGQPTATAHWSFDQIGKTDVPLALNKVFAETGKEIDVIAHCMGTVVFSIAVLKGLVLPGRVHRAAFTQVGPLVVFSPANIFRGYVLRYLIDFLPESYSFNPTAPTLADDLWDRLLSTLPYPVEEFDIENPKTPWKRTPWTRTRHRMDALYGRDFNVRNMDLNMLRFIDEHFGPLSLRTVSQTLHFARYSMITNFQGRNTVVSRGNLSSLWDFPTFSVHGADNGLSHVSTVDRMRQIFEDAGRVYLEPHIIPNAGHQDALVGTKRFDTLAKIEQFLEAPTTPSPGPANTAFVAYPPWIGPIITEERPNTPALVIRLGTMPTHKKPEGVIMLRVAINGNQIDRPDGLPWDLDYILAHAVLYMSPELEIHGWDAFEAPLPKAMPGFNPAYPGDGLLVLVVYAESPALLATTAAHIRANLATMVPTLELFDPLGGPLDLPGVPAGVPRDVLAIEFDDFRRMSEAVLHVLECQSFAAASSSYSQTPGPGQLVLLAAPDITGIELKVKTPPNLDLPKSLLAFGMMSMADGQAVLDELLLQDRDLMDGVIPYDPPEFPPATPDPAGTSFALASCQYPGGLLDESIAYGAYGRLVERITGAPGIQPRFTVFAGDQVYVDPTAGLYDPTAQDDRYERPYHAWLRQLSVRSALRRVPSFMLLDDHEIADNWEPLGAVDAPSNEEKRIRGVDAYKQYQRGMKVNYGASPVFSFEFDGFPFFMLDTRSKRDHRTVGSLSGAELFDGTTTLPALKTWLQNHNGPKFVVTPAMLLPRHRRAVQRDARLDTTNLSSLHSDGWDGYPGTLQETLGFIAKEKIEHVVFLSGDEHRGCVASVELRSGGGTLLTRAHSIHTAGTYAPFPFVNSLEEDFVSSEVIDFTYLGNNYRCVVNAVFPNPGNGATFLRARQDTANVWQLDYEFADGTVQTLAI